MLQYAHQAVRISFTLIAHYVVCFFFPLKSSKNFQHLN